MTLFLIVVAVVVGFYIFGLVIRAAVTEGVCTALQIYGLNTTIAEGVQQGIAMANLDREDREKGGQYEKFGRVTRNSGCV